MMASPLVRAALMVRDLEKSRAFYAAVVGLTQEFFHGDLGGTTANAIIGTPAHSAIRSVILKAPGVDYGMLGLFELDPSTPATVARVGGMSLGETVLVFYVEDLHAALDAAWAHGGTPATPVKILNQRSEVALRDPDGVAINLIERPVSDAYRQRAPGDPLSWPPSK